MHDKSYYFTKGQGERPEENAINVNNDCAGIKRIKKPLSSISFAKMFISIEGPLVYSDASNTKRLKLDQGLAPHGHFQLPDPGPLTQASELKAGADPIYSAVSYIKGNDVLERTR